MQKAGPTIQEVARVAGVSPASVSRFLNGRLTLPEATAERIRAAVVQLGYRPNAIARRLRSGTSETLGLITADIAYPLFATIASAAEAEASEAGYSLVMFSSRNRAESEIGFLSRVEDRQLDGVLLLTNHLDDGRLAARINACKAVVLVDEDVPGAEAPRLFADNEAGGLAAGRHLVAAGHTRIAHVTGPAGLLSVDERQRGFEAALAEAGLALDPALVVSGRYDESFGAEAFRAAGGAAGAADGGVRRRRHAGDRHDPCSAGGRRGGAAGPVDRRLRRHSAREPARPAADDDPPVGRGVRAARCQDAGGPGEGEGARRSAGAHPGGARRARLGRRAAREDGGGTRPIESGAAREAEFWRPGTAIRKGTERMTKETFAADAVKIAMERFQSGQIDRRTLLTALGALGLVAVARPGVSYAQAKEVVLCNWGGAAVEAFQKAYGEPFTKKSGIKVAIDGAGPTTGAVRAMVESRR